MNPFLLTLVNGQAAPAVYHGHNADPQILATNGFVDKEAMLKSATDYKKYVALSRIPPIPPLGGSSSHKGGRGRIPPIPPLGGSSSHKGGRGRIPPIPPLGGISSHKGGRGRIPPIPPAATAAILSHKDIELSQTTGPELAFTCDDIGFAGYQVCTEAPLAGKYCCKTEQVPLLEKCPKGSTYHNNLCWVESTFQYVCLEEGFMPQNGMCIKHETEKPLITCPQRNPGEPIPWTPVVVPGGGDFRIQCTMDECFCVAGGEGEIQECSGGGAFGVDPYWLNGECVIDRSGETCPAGYDLIGEPTQYCKLTWEGECTKMDILGGYIGPPAVPGPVPRRSWKAAPPAPVPRLRGLKEKSTALLRYPPPPAPWSVDISEAINSGKEESSKDSSKYKDESSYEQRKTILDGSRAITKAKAKVAEVQSKVQKVQADIAKQRNIKLALEAYDASKKSTALSILGGYIGPPAVPGPPAPVPGKAKVFYESNTHVASKCTYTDILPASFITTTKAFPTITVPAPGIVIPVERVCLSDGFVFDFVTDECVSFAEKEQAKRCAGVVVNDKCLSSVPKDATCPMTWVLTYGPDPPRPPPGPGGQHYLGVPGPPAPVPGRDNPVCQRTDVKAGKYTWKTDFDCVGDPKFCEALFAYKG